MSRRTVIRMFPPGDYTDRLNVAYTAYQDALQSEDQTPRTALEGDPVAELKAEYEALRGEAIEAAKTERRYVRMEGISRRQMRALKEHHPPRTEGDEDTVKADRYAGMNLESVEDDLVFASIVEPQFTSRADFDEWANDVLSEGDFDVLSKTAYDLAQVSQYDPKSLSASPTPNTATNDG